MLIFVITQLISKKRSVVIANGASKVTFQFYKHPKIIVKYCRDSIILLTNIIKYDIIIMTT